MPKEPLASDALLTVIVLTYNQEDYVEKAVESITSQQTDFPFRVLIHDDASTDGTAEILQSLASRWPDKIDLILREENMFSQGNNPRPTLLLGASSRYVAWCDGDDSWTDSHKLQKQIDFLEANPWCSLSHTGVEVVGDADSDNRVIEQVRHWESEGRNRSDRISGIDVVRSNPIMTCSAVVRRDRLRDRALHASFDVSPGDLIVWSLALEEGEAAFFPEQMAAYRVHGGNIWAGADPDQSRASLDGAYHFLAKYAQGPVQEEAAKISVERWLERERSIPSIEDLDFRFANAEETIAALTEDRDFYRDSTQSLSEQIGESQQALAESQQALAEMSGRLRSVTSSRGWRGLEAVRGVWGGRWSVMEDPKL